MSATMPWARDEQMRLRKLLVKNQQEQVKTYEKSDGQEERMVCSMTVVWRAHTNEVRFQDKLEKELRKAKRSKEKFIDSSLIHGSNQRFTPEVLIAALEREIGKDASKVRVHSCCLRSLDLISAIQLDKTVRHIRNVQTRERNYEDDLKEVEAVIVAESGALVTRIQAKRRIRAICLNPNNFTSNDVTGEATGKGCTVDSVSTACF